MDDEIAVAFEYPFMNDVMRIVKEEEPEILEQSYDMDCLMKLRIRRLYGNWIVLAWRKLKQPELSNNPFGIIVGSMVFPGGFD